MISSELGVVVIEYCGTYKITVRACELGGHQVMGPGSFGTWEITRFLQSIAEKQ